MEYTRVSEYEREPFVGNYHPSGHRQFTEKVVYQEDVIGESRHLHRHRHPETLEVVKVVEYEVPERRVGELIYEENKIAYPYDRRYWMQESGY